MEKGSELCVLRDCEAPVKSPQTLMVAALVTFGIGLDKDCPYTETREIINGKEQRVVTWTLAASSPDGQYKTADLVAAWHSRDFGVKNPEHPFAYVKQALSNYRRLVDTIKTAAPLMVVRKGKKIALIPADATEGRRKQLLEELEK